MRADPDAVAAAPALAVQPDEVLPDPALETRARDISKVLRCPVCQGETIDESNAPISRDLRLYVRERLVAGDSDDQVVDAVTDRFGEFVLFEPPRAGGELAPLSGRAADGAAGAVSGLALRPPRDAGRGSPARFRRRKGPAERDHARLTTRYSRGHDATAGLFAARPPGHGPQRRGISWHIQTISFSHQDGASPR
jgi:hypothetical protein